MTRKEFLEQAAKQVNFQNLEDTRDNALDCFRNKLGITVDVDFLLNFFHENGFKGGSLGFSRSEKKSNDILRITFSCMPWTTCFWEDIGQYVSMVVYINGCTFNHSGTHHIESFYLSENGLFWDEKHSLRFEKEEELFDYLLTIEYDFHPVIPEKTFEMLRHFGWCEGRRVDTTDFERELKKHGIVLSQIQLDAISEFSGLQFLFSRSSWNLEFNSIERMIDDLSCNKLDFRPEVYDFHSKRLIGKNVLEFGWYDMGYFSISEDGKIFLDGDDPRGRNILEFIYAFEIDMPENVSWL